ncbi:MAG: hypothetical protein JW881_19605 [Spirochaetales bacterium]|nr:hypothetical protein [Spirochaetales bacterium]
MSQCFHPDKKTCLSRTRNIAGCLTLLLVLISVTCCGPRIKGYGVVLWAEKDSGLQNGDVVEIRSESRIRKSYIVRREGGAKNIPIVTRRVEVFTTREDSEAFAERYAPYTTLYAYSDKDGIPPVREKPLNSKDVKIITKPKAYQVMKVIDKTDEKTIIGSMDDFWYLVLIEYQGIGPSGNYELLGEKGYCFGHYLNIIDTREDPEKEIETVRSESNEDDQLDLLMNTVFRPSYYLDMIRKGRIDLERFSSAIGLFPEPAVNRITIKKSDGYYVFDYSDITRVSSSLFSFSNADIRIEMLSPERISVTYNASGKQVNELFVIIDEDIDELCEREKAFRKALYNDFYIRGKILSSSAYGTITLDEDFYFTWKGFEKLVPSIIPRSARKNGNVDFPFFLSQELGDQYDGVITFYFDGYRSEKGINFLYKFTDQGVRFISALEEYIIEREVTRIGLNPIIIFFTFSG